MRQGGSVSCCLRPLPPYIPQPPLRGCDGGPLRPERLRSGEVEGRERRARASRVPTASPPTGRLLSKHSGHEGALRTPWRPPPGWSRGTPGASYAPGRGGVCGSPRPRTFYLAFGNPFSLWSSVWDRTAVFRTHPGPQLLWHGGWPGDGSRGQTPLASRGNQRLASGFRPVGRHADIWHLLNPALY